MFGSSTYHFTLATEDDADALRRLADLDSQAPLAGRVLIGQIAGSPAAALSLDDDRVVADPFRRTDHLVACLRSRAAAMRAYEASPSLSERMRAAAAGAGREPGRPAPRLRLSWNAGPTVQDSCALVRG